MKVKISTINIYFSVMVMLMRACVAIRKVNYLNELLMICQLLIFLNYGIKIFSRKEKMSMLTKLMVFMYIMLFIATCVVSRDFTGYITNTVYALTSIFIVEYHIKNDKKILLRSLRDWLSILLICNTIIVFIYPNGLVGIGDVEHFLFGKRTEFSPFVILFLMVTLIYDKLEYGKLFSKYTVFVLSISVIGLIEQKVVTGIAGVLIAIAFIVIYHIGKIKFLTLNKFILAYSIFFIAIVIFSMQYNSRILNYILVDVMDKDLTFNHRTYIWNSTLEEIKEKPILGYGISSSGKLLVKFPTRVGEASAHNQILHTLHEGGIISFLIYVAIFIMINKNIERNKNEYISQINKSIMIAFLVMMITEVQSHRCLMFFALVLAYFTDILVENKEDLEISNKEIINSENQNNNI